MKTCEYCGRENEDSAARCQECGTEFVSPPPPVETPPRWDKIATIETEVEAERLDVDLNSREIPNVRRSNTDPAFNGIFQTTRGWGQAKGPAKQPDGKPT